MHVRTYVLPDWTSMMEGSKGSRTLFSRSERLLVWMNRKTVVERETKAITSLSLKMKKNEEKLDS